VANLTNTDARAAGNASGAKGRTLRWNGRDDNGALLGRGVYFVRAEAGGAVLSAKLVHLGE